MGAHRPRSLEEQPGRLGSHDRVGRGALISKGQRRNSPDPLARQTEGFAASGQDTQTRPRPEQVLDQDGAGVDEVLTVVDHDQQLPVGHEALQGVEHRSSRFFPCANGVSHGLADQLRV